MCIDVVKNIGLKSTGTMQKVTVIILLLPVYNSIFLVKEGFIKLFSIKMFNAKTVR